MRQHQHQIGKKLSKFDGQNCEPKLDQSILKWKVKSSLGIKPIFRENFFLAKKLYIIERNKTFIMDKILSENCTRILDCNIV